MFVLEIIMIFGRLLVLSTYPKWLALLVLGHRISVETVIDFLLAVTAFYCVGVFFDNRLGRYWYQLVIVSQATHAYTSEPRMQKYFWTGNTIDGNATYFTAVEATSC